nr:hypothetical protein [Tanacetum cinerariifolium]
MIELVMHTVKNDMVIYTEKTGMMILMVEIECVGKIADVFDKATWSFDGLQPEQVDLNEIEVFVSGWYKPTRVVPPIEAALSLEKDQYAISGDVGYDVLGIPTSTDTPYLPRWIQSIGCQNNNLQMSSFKLHNACLLANLHK